MITSITLKTKAMNIQTHQILITLSYFTIMYVLEIIYSSGFGPVEI